MATKTTKNYVLDTNVVLSDPHAIDAFAEHNVIIPPSVLQEVNPSRKDKQNAITRLVLSSESLRSSKRLLQLSLQKASRFQEEDI